MQRLIDVNTWPEIPKIRNSLWQDNAISSLQEILNSLDYKKRFLDTHTKDISIEINIMDASLQKLVEIELNKLKEPKILTILWENDITSAKKRWKEYWNALKSVKKVDIIVEWESLELDIESARVIILNKFENNLEQKNKKVMLLKKLEERKNELLISLESILLELKENDSVDLIEALNKWWSSPNKNWDKWINGDWYNAWLIHYFEYMSYNDKVWRINKDNFSISNFIEYTNKFFELINNLDSNNIIWYWIYIDNNWNQRKIIYTKTSKTITYNWKIITIMPTGQLNENKLKQNLEKSIEWDEWNRLNKLWEWKRIEKIVIKV